MFVMSTLSVPGKALSAPSFAPPAPFILGAGGQPLLLLRQTETNNLKNN